MEKLIIIDSNALAYRGYHALPELTTPDGRLVNAIYGFFLVFLKALSDFDADYVCACFDRPEPTFRHKKFKDYKAQRPKTPDDLISQMSLLKKTLKTMGVPIFEQPGYEADDLIATIVAKMGQKYRSDRSRKYIGHIGPMENIIQMEVIIATGDLDALQLVAPRVKAYILGRGVKDAIIYDEQKVRERYGFSPTLLADYRGLKGDASDNIPGVPGIGPKTATKLLHEFGSLEGVYEYIGQMGQEIHRSDRTNEMQINTNKCIGRMGPILEKYKEQAFLSRDLAKMRKDAPIEFNVNRCCLKNYNKEKAESVFRELGFKTLISRLPGNRRKQKSLI